MPSAEVLTDELQIDCFISRPVKVRKVHVKAEIIPLTVAVFVFTHICEIGRASCRERV